MGMTPQGRVEAYIDDYVAVWKAEPRPVRLTSWRVAMSSLDARHYATGRIPSQACASFGEPCPHGSERVIETKVLGETARVVTQDDSYRHMSSFFEYRLVRNENDWWITLVRKHLDHPDDPVVRLRDRRWLDAPRRNTQLTQAKQPPECVLDANRHQIGELELRSGILLVQDLSYGSSAFRPLTRRVDPGSYPVETILNGSYVAAVLVRLRSTDAQSWCVAEAVGGGTASGVDAGNIAIVDAASYVSLTVGRKADIYEATVVAGTRPRMHFACLKHDNDAFVCDSGVGDGGYPRYWGVDASGNLACLLIDFLLL